MRIKSNNVENNGGDAPQVKKRNIIKIVFRFFAWIIGVGLLLLVLLFCGIAWILTPDRLTPIIENAVNKSISADFSLGRAELSVWSTFPRLQLEVDSLVIANGVFDSLPAEERAKLPVGSDTLLRVGGFSGSVNVPALLIGDIRLSGVRIGDAAVNIVSYDKHLSNFDIFPASESEKKDSGETSLPDISIDRLMIAGKLPIRYVSVADSIDFEMTLMESDVISGINPGYKVSLSSSIEAFFPPEIKIDSINIGLDGKIDWLHEKPTEVKLSDFVLAIGNLKADFDADIDFKETPQLRSFMFSINPFSPVDVIRMLPENMRSRLPEVETDMLVSSTIRLVKPYCPVDSSLPFLDVAVNVPECRLAYGSYRFNELEFKADANINGGDLNDSRLDIKRLQGGIDGAEFSFSGIVTSFMKDLYVNGKVKATANLANLPASVKADIPGTVKGLVKMDASARFHQSDLSLKSFHKMFLEGNLELDDVEVSLPSFDIELYARSARFDLGTNNKFVTDASRADSLLTASVKVDTLSFGSSGMALQGKDLRAGVGCSNKGLPKDTMTIIPLGATIYARELAYVGDDTTVMRLRDTYAFTSLTRFNQDARAPLFKFQAGMKRVFYADKLNRLLLNNGSLEFNAHLRAIGKVEKKMKERYDSIARANPGLAQDSLIAIYKSSFPRRGRRTSTEVMDFGLDNSTKRILMKWDVSGSVRAEHGAMFSPYFPLRNRLSNFNVSFSADSIVFKNILYKVGHSDFLINGKVRNVRRALALGFPLKAEFYLSSDSLNVNELVQASYKGAAFAEKVMSGSVAMANVENTASIDSLVDQAASTGQTAALLVPSNLSANMKVEARNITYSNMMMHDFAGDLLVGNGSVNLRNLSASSNMGSARLSALYSAPDKNNIRFGFGLQMNNVDVKQFIGMMPAVDSLMPLLGSFQGKINADIAATTDVDSVMDVVIPSLNAAVKLSGDSLVILDAETFQTVSKWLLFKNKKENVIPHMAVEMLIEDSKVELFPFVFDFDRYRLAVMGSNDLALNFKYHISVLKSPVPFKFGINLSGNPDKMKVRLGGAKYKSGKAGETIAIVDTAKVNLLREMDNVFRRGARNARLGALKVNAKPENLDVDAPNDTISRADSLIFIKEGLIEVPDSIGKNDRK